MKEVCIKLLRRFEQIDELKKIPLFSALSKRDLNLIAKHADQVTLKAGKVLAKEGELGREFMILLDGRAKVKKGNRTVRTLSKGDYFGEISLIQPGLRTATVVAETEVTLMVISSRSFNYLLNNVAGLAKRVLFRVTSYLLTENPSPKRI